MIVQKASVCPLDCPDTCSLAVTVSGDQVLAVRGSKVNPITHGAICAKVANSYPEFVHGPNRLRYPLRRIGPKGKGNFERTSWNQALGIIHHRVGSVVERYGPQAVLPLNYAGPHGMLAGDSMSLRFFHGLGASLLSRNPLCGGIRSAAYAGTFGATPGTPLQQVRSEEHTSELQSRQYLVCRLLLEKKKKVNLTTDQTSRIITYVGTYQSTL